MARDHAHRSLVDVVRGIARARRRSTRRARWFGHRVVELLDVDLTRRGAERVPPGRAYVYMSNHQSHLDIPMLYATLPSPTIRMLAKKELFQIPLWGTRAARRRVHRGRSREPRARGAIDRARGAADPRWRERSTSRPKARGRATAGSASSRRAGFTSRSDTGTPIVPVAIRGTIDILPRGDALDAQAASASTSRSARRSTSRAGDPSTLMERSAAISWSNTSRTSGLFAQRRRGRFCGILTP